MTVANNISRQRQPKSNVWCVGDPTSWIVAETPNEVAEMVRDAMRSGESLIQLTLANDNDWNGRAVYLRPHAVAGIAPPVSDSCE